MPTMWARSICVCLVYKLSKPSRMGDGHNFRADPMERHKKQDAYRLKDISSIKAGKQSPAQPINESSV